MRQIRAAAITLLVLVLFGGIIWAALRPHQNEPVYQGKNLSFLLNDYYHQSQNLSPSSTNYAGAINKNNRDQLAIHEIGTNAIPCLLKLISSNDGPLKRKILKWTDKFPWLPFRPQSSYQKQSLAILGFSVLGPHARPAVPGLIEIVKRADSDDPAFPMAALAEIDHDAAVRAGVIFDTNGRISGRRQPPPDTNK